MILRTGRARRSQRRLLSLLIALAICFTVYVPARMQNATVKNSPPQTTTQAIQGEEEDPFNRINIIHTNNGVDVGRETQEFASDDVTRSDVASPPKKHGGQGRKVKSHPKDKIHPTLVAELANWQKGLQQDGIKQIIINFRDHLTIPRFPSPATGEPRDSAFNRDIEARTARMIEDIQHRRAPAYKKIRKELKRQFKGEVTGEFWLINGVTADMSLSALPQLALRDDVLSIEPSVGGEPPPQDTNTGNDVEDGRALIGSDPYFNLGYSGTYIGLLDTGVRSTHTLLSSNFGYLRDCVNGGTDCNTTTNPGYNTNDDFWNHGTASAAIITGNANLGARYRGVTSMTVDSWKVYTNAGLDTNATLRAFQAAVNAFDRVIVAEIQANGTDTSSISTAADNAFNAGAVVIAANGNNGPSASTVNAPANAHKAIGVGDVDVQTQTIIASQSRGPAPDGRIKPDIQAPTNTETASNASDTALRVFTGTSGSTPYAAGAAALLRARLMGSNSAIDPGQVYSHLILSGRQPAFDNNNGCGLIFLPPVNGTEWFGKVSVSNGSVIDIPLNILAGGTLNTLNGALWWPETATQTHNDIDLYLVDPSGVERVSSISTPSVFERARVDGAITTGSWKLRIRGYSVTGTQTVYWSAHVRRS